MNITHPYSLHDCSISSIRTSENTLLLDFKTGIVRISDNVPVAATLCFNEVDWDFCSIYLIEYTSIRSGNVGRFTGEKLNLKEFIVRQADDQEAASATVSMEVIDETYGYNQSKFNGYTEHDGRMKEFIIEIYHFAEMIYQTEV